MLRRCLSTAAFARQRPETTLNPLATSRRQQEAYRSPYETQQARVVQTTAEPLTRRPYERILTIRKAVHVTSKGKHVKFDAWCLAGDQNGSVGCAHARSTQPSKAIQAALRVARKSMKFYPLFEQRTLYHDIDAKFRQMHLRLMPKPPGHSVRAQRTVYDLCQALGIQDMSAKIMAGGTNPVTIAKTFLHALNTMHFTPENVAQKRGLKLSDVRMHHHGTAASS
jgi:ribosomal protein S5